MSAKHHHKDKKEDANSTSSLKKMLHGDAESVLHAELLEHPSYLELQSKLTEAEEKATQNWDRALRIQAEMDNMQRRAKRDVSDAHQYALKEFMLGLLPVIDSLERAVTLSTGNNDSGVIEGVDMTLKMFRDVLGKFGAEQIDPINQPFNPELHQAVSAQESADAASGTVLQVLQKGYSLNNRLIRPALVIVAK